MTNPTNPQIAALEAKLVPLAPQVDQVKAVFQKVAAKEEVGLELAVAVRVLTEHGHVRYSTRAGRLMLTEQGQKFYRQMKRFG